MAQVYIIPGDPIPLAQARCVGRRVFDSQRQVKIHARICLESQQDNTPPFINVPLCIDITFFMGTPKNQKLINKYMKQKYHIFTPDLDNMIKLICDVSNDLLYKDDCLVAKIIAQKVYTEQNPRTEFTLTEIKL